MSSATLASLAELDVPAELGGALGLQPHRLRLRRAWPRSAEHLLLEYEAGDRAIVAAQWHSSHERAERAIVGLAEESIALCDLDPAQGSVTLHLRGADRRLPGLARLLMAPGAELIVHQPERRAVVRLSEPAGPVFAKVVRPGRARALAAVGEAAGRLAGDAFAVPRLLGVDELTGVVRWSALAGVALHDLAGECALVRAWHAAGQALRALHAAPPTLLAPMEHHGPVAEGGVLVRWLAFVAAFDPGFAQRVAVRAAGAYAALIQGSGPVTALHRDFYDKQILFAEDGRIGLLDFDTLAYGEPALDLANALVHLELRALQGLLDDAQALEARAALLAGYAPSPAVQGRLAAYADATRLRLACVYRFRPRWRYCAEAMLSRVGLAP